MEENREGVRVLRRNHVLLSEQELKRAAPEATKAVEIESFVNIDDIDPLYFDKPYYLEPGKGGQKGYVLLRETLKKNVAKSKPTRKKTSRKKGRVNDGAP